MANEKESKEEKYNEKKLEANYEQTKYCPKCGMKLSIDGKCGSLICS